MANATPTDANEPRGIRIDDADLEIDLVSHSNQTYVDPILLSVNLTRLPVANP